MTLTITQPAAAAAVECGNGGTGRLCDFCEEAPALVYCRADSARLCLACDRLVHAANTVSARHSRSLLCDACISSPATILRGSAPSASGQSHEGQPLLLCSNCDYDALQGDGEISRPAERRVVEPYSGCPTAEEMISLLGVPAEGVKLQFLADDDQDIFADVGGWVWETPPILCVEDLLLPPVSPAGGFPAMGVPPPPKDRNLGCGRHKGEILRQLRGLESDMDSYASFDFNQEAAADAYQAHPLNLPSATGENAWVENQWVLPSTEQLPEIAVDAVEGKALVVGNNAPVIAGERPQPPPLASRSKIPPPDRRLVLSRYKEKRKTRRFDKQIRYESRKARAEGRERIKGRFVKLGRSSVT